VNLRGKVVLVTGARRVGADLARLLAERGASVALTYFTSREAIERTVADVEARGASGLAVAADLARADQAEQTIVRVVAHFGRLDALVNMASVYRRTPFSTLTPGDFDALIAANLAAPYHTAVAAARQMLTQPGEQGIKGKIVNIGDWATERPYKHYLPYLVAKGGLTTMTLALAMIAPPPDFSEADREAVAAATPLRRVGSPDDVNRLILYLLEGTDFATGACYRVDGGRFLGPEE
jgi:pteridine reductase